MLTCRSCVFGLRLLTCRLAYLDFSNLLRVFLRDWNLILSTYRIGPGAVFDDETFITVRYVYVATCMGVLLLVVDSFIHEKFGISSYIISSC